MHHTRPGSVQIRGMAPRYAPFIYQFWHSPEVLKIVSDLAGVELVPALDYEISHTNVQLGPEGLDAVRKTPVESPMATEEALASYEQSKQTTVLNLWYVRFSNSATPSSSPQSVGIAWYPQCFPAQ